MRISGLTDFYLPKFLERKRDNPKAPIVLVGTDISQREEMGKSNNVITTEDGLKLAAKLNANKYLEFDVMNKVSENSRCLSWIKISSVQKRISNQIHLHSRTTSKLSSKKSSVCSQKARLSQSSQKSKI
jgi:hypothetical protein